MVRTSKAKKIQNRWRVIILFSVISLVLLVNNISDLFVKFGLFVQIQWVAWIGLVLVVGYNMWLASEDKI